MLGATGHASTVTALPTLTGLSRRCRLLQTTKTNTCLYISCLLAVIDLRQLLQSISAFFHPAFGIATKSVGK